MAKNKKMEGSKENIERDLSAWDSVKSEHSNEKSDNDVDMDMEDRDRMDKGLDEDM